MPRSSARTLTASTPRRAQILLTWEGYRHHDLSFSRLDILLCYWDPTRLFLSNRLISTAYTRARSGATGRLSFYRSRKASKQARRIGSETTLLRRLRQIAAVNIQSILIPTSIIITTRSFRLMDPACVNAPTCPNNLSLGAL
jgi:hypothetical protein